MGETQKWALGSRSGCFPPDVVEPQQSKRPARAREQRRLEENLASASAGRGFSIILVIYRDINNRPSNRK
jgi:hypothetical protein